DVIVREVAGPDGCLGVATAEHDANRDFAFLHYALAVFFAIVGIAPAGLCDEHVVEVQVDLADVEVRDARIPDGGQDTAEVRIGRVERGLDERRMADRVGDLPAFSNILAAFDRDRHEL